MSPTPDPTPIAYGPALAEPFHIRLLQVQQRDIDAGWNTRQVRSSFWRLYVNSRLGASLILGDRRRFALSARRVHLVPAWCLFDCHCRRTVPHLFLHFDWFGVPATRLSEAFDRPVTLAVDAVLDALADSLRQKLARDSEELDGPDIYAHAISLAYLAVSRLLNQTNDAQVSRLLEPLARGGPVAPALEAIESNPGARPTNTQLAALCHLSVDHFIRRFRKQVGQTPARYAEERRVALAAEKLVYTDDTIEQIADALGYPDRFGFTRVFTKRMGLPPATYRRQPLV